MTNKAGGYVTVFHACSTAGWLDQSEVCAALGLRPRTHAHSSAQLQPFPLE